METISIERAIQLNSNVLAFVGDAVFTLYIRTSLVEKSDAKTNMLHTACNKYVKAISQAKMFENVFLTLTPIEGDVAKRARNCHTGTKAKNAGLADYKKATSLEAVIGFLYLTGQDDRLKTILSNCKSVMEENKPNLY